MADIEFGVLGELTIRSADVRIRLRGARRRNLLAALLLRANRTVSAAELGEMVWGGDHERRVPDIHRGALQVQVTRLRAALGAAPPEPLIIGGPQGYRVELADDRLDLLRFRGLTGAAREAECRGDPQGRCDALRRALDVWRGPVLCDVASRVLHRTDAASVTEELLQTAEQHLELALALGRDEPVLGWYSRLAGRYPHRETLVRLQMVALYRSGRPSEALDLYAGTRRALARRLGVDPGRELQATFEGVLRGDLEDRPLMPRQRGAPRVRASPAGRAAGHWPSPAQLPADVPQFVGRDAELASLDRMVATGPERAARALVSGPPGVGCTALAVHWAHRAARSFPDGQLYVDLRGETAAPRAPGDVMRRFLGAFGVTKGVPAETDERSALLRSVLSTRRVLMVLDNAGSADQVRPLVPGTANCGVVVTSRYWLADLIVRDGVPAVPLGELSLEEAARLLAGLVGAGRADSEPGALRSLVEAAGRLPLPLRMAGAWLATHPDSPIRVLVARVDARRDDTAMERVMAAVGSDARFLIGSREPRGGEAWRE